MRWPRIRALVLLVLLAGSGCDTVPEVGRGGLHLLDLLPPAEVLEGDGPPAVKLKEWQLAEGLPAGWRTGPGTKVAELGPEGLHLTAPGAPWLEIRINVDALRYEKLMVTFDPGQGEAAELYYSYGNPPLYHVGGRVRAHHDSAGTPDRFEFKLPHPDGAEEQLKSFRLYPGGKDGGHYTVKTVTLVPRRGRFLGEAILSRDRIDLSQEYRRCWRLVDHSERRVTFRVPGEGAVLNFGTGTLLGGGRARLSVEASADGREPQVLLQTTFGRRGEGWQNHRVDLTPWAGTDLTLWFRVEPEEESRAIRLVGAPVVRPADPRPRPNVILLVVDTLRADRLSAYGHPRRNSPHLDRLARQGLLFSQARAPASWTIPSTAALLTGCYPVGPRVDLGAAPAVAPSSVTLAEQLSGEGYATGGFSANFVLDGFRGFARGFDTWYAAPFQDFHRTARQLNRRALDWVETVGDRPFFLYLHYMDPHAPYDAPTVTNPRGRGARPFDIRRGHCWEDGSIIPLVTGWEKLEKPGDFRRFEHFYHQEVSYVDRSLGHLLASLRARGLLEGALVMVTADHGEELADHGHWSHGYSLYEEVLRVPLVLAGSGLGERAGTVEQTPVSLVDAAPTLAVMAGLDAAPAPRDGENLLEALPGRTFFASSAVCGLPPRYSVFDGRYAYIRFMHGVGDDPPEESRGARYLRLFHPPAEALYDLLADPLERDNLADRLPGEVSRLSRILEAQYPQVAEDPGLPTAEGTDLERLRLLGYIE